jgi:hypothetical protein
MLTLKIGFTRKALLAPLGYIIYMSIKIAEIGQKLLKTSTLQFLDIYLNSLWMLR